MKPPDADFLVSNDNPALFSTQPAVASNGTLTYDPAPNAIGAANVTVTLGDNGGTRQRRRRHQRPRRRSRSRQPPERRAVLHPGAPPDRESKTPGPQPWPAGRPTSAPARRRGRSGARLHRRATSNDALFSAAARGRRANGTLTYTPAANANGTPTVTVRCTTTAATLNGGLTPAPADVRDHRHAGQRRAELHARVRTRRSAEDSGAQTVAAGRRRSSAGPANEAGQAVTFLVTNNNNALFAAAAGDCRRRHADLHARRPMPTARHGHRAGPGQRRHGQRRRRHQRARRRSRSPSPRSTMRRASPRARTRP